MAKKVKKDAKEIMLPHSKAKVRFFKSYLERYLPILCLSPFVKQVNIVDAFCGQGEFLDGGLGSPIETYLAIKSIVHSPLFEKNETKIVHIINDNRIDNTNKVNSYIEQNGGVNGWNFRSFNYNYEDFKEYLINSLNSLTTDSRTLIFIDPYGYKDIDKFTISRLTNNLKTEVVLWLPIADIKRFIDKSKNSDEPAYLPLRKLIEEFFPNDLNRINSKMSSFEIINEFTKALRVNNLYSTSYYLQRDKVNYYALFLLTPNNLGFEKILEVKWELDEANGRGYEIKSKGLFDNEFAETDRTKNFDFLKQELREFIKEPKNNIEIRDFVLALEFLPKHIKLIINDMIKSNLIECNDIHGNKLNKISLDSLDYKPWKEKKILYEIKRIK